jgi:hypothetical protein
MKELGPPPTIPMRNRRITRTFARYFIIIILIFKIGYRQARQRETSALTRRSQPDTKQEYEF